MEIDTEILADLLNMTCSVSRDRIGMLPQPCHYSVPDVPFSPVDRRKSHNLKSDTEQTSTACLSKLPI